MPDSEEKLTTARGCIGRLQNTIRWLRRGKTLEEAARLSNVPMSVVKQLVEWGQSRPSARITQEFPEIASE
ncbi:MAG: hypothetical protein HC784_15375 [Hydrococcus sp. CSU_1_8]|nr:hypothetical protein [Hydrococcus sp. CSU_1_8]